MQFTLLTGIGHAHSLSLASSLIRVFVQHVPVKRKVNGQLVHARRLLELPLLMPRNKTVSVDYLFLFMWKPVYRYCMNTGFWFGSVYNRLYDETGFRTLK